MLCRRRILYCVILYKLLRIYAFGSHKHNEGQSDINYLEIYAWVIRVAVEQRFTNCVMFPSVHEFVIKIKKNLCRFYLPNKDQFFTLTSIGENA